MFYIYPYKKGSQSVALLKEHLAGKIIKLEGSRYRQKIEHKLINWGNSHMPDWLANEDTILNKPSAVAIAKDKLETLHTLEQNNIATVEFTDDFGTAHDWLVDGYKVFARHSLTGHSGAGIEVIDRQMIEDLPDAPLYTRGVENHGEYRVHVFQGEVILYQKKSRRLDEDGNVVDADGEEADVRNLASNWIYRTGNLRRLERIEQLAINAVEALGLDFGAVDIIKDEEGNVFVLEINSAPGLGNTETLQAYRRAFMGEPAQLPEQDNNN